MERLARSEPHSPLHQALRIVQPSDKYNGKYSISKAVFKSLVFHYIGDVLYM
jgi:hypothetical protein